LVREAQEVRQEQRVMAQETMELLAVIPHLVLIFTPMGVVEVVAVLVTLQRTLLVLVVVERAVLALMLLLDQAHPQLVDFLQFLLLMVLAVVGVVIVVQVVYLANGVGQVAVGQVDQLLQQKKVVDQFLVVVAVAVAVVGINTTTIEQVLMVVVMDLLILKQLKAVVVRVQQH
jgi:hypothetical protein